MDIKNPQCVHVQILAHDCKNTQRATYSIAPANPGEQPLPKDVVADLVGLMQTPVPVTIGKNTFEVVSDIAILHLEDSEGCITHSGSIIRDEKDSSKLTLHWRHRATGDTIYYEMFGDGVLKCNISPISSIELMNYLRKDAIKMFNAICNDDRLVDGRPRLFVEPKDGVTVCKIIVENAHNYFTNENVWDKTTQILSFSEYPQEVQIKVHRAE